MNEVIEAKARELSSVTSVEETIQNKRIVQKVMETVMKKDTHYGVIPGCKQPSLYKAGSESLLSTFHISAEPIVEEFITRDDKGRATEIRYRIKCVGRHSPTGNIVGYGIGECSTNETKYAWRRAVCAEEFAETDETRRRYSWGKWNNKVQKTEQVAVSPADMANTVLKMAKKRAQIDMTLTTLGCSDIFAQDIEDLDEALRENFSSDPQPSVPVDTGPPACTDELFNEKKDDWRETVESGKQTAEALLAKLVTRATFTDAQRQTILAWKAKPKPAQQQDTSDFDAGLDASGEYVPQ